jgi:hypothetical protein
MSDHANESGSNFDPISFLKLHQRETATIFYIKYTSYFVPCRIYKSETNDRIAYAAYLTSSERFIAAFTDPEELARWPYKYDKGALMSFDNLKSAVMNDSYNLSGIIIDPFSKKLILRQRQIKQIDLVTEGSGVHNFSNSRNIKLNKLIKEIPALKEALQKFFRDFEYVYKAFVLEVKEPGKSERLLVVVDFDGQTNQLFPPLAKVIRTTLNQGEFFEMVKATHSLLNAAASLCEPIYQKY